MWATGSSLPKKNTDPEVETAVRDLLIGEMANGQIVGVLFLTEVSGERELLLTVGLDEARAIELERQRVLVPRPMTHDAWKNSLVLLKTLVEKVVITKVKHDIFYSELWLDRMGERHYMDVRPGDGIALALRFDMPIYARESVLHEYGKVPEQSQSEIDKVVKRYLENIGPKDPV